MTDQATKACRKCKEVKPETVFGKDGRGRRGWTCNSCRNKTRKGRVETPAQRLTRKLWQEYKLTPEQHTAILHAQNGVCAICRKPPGGGKRLAVDHCHATGVVRALLCTGCNVAVGRYESHRNAAEAYLAVYGAGNPLLKP